MEKVDLSMFSTLQCLIYPTQKSLADKKCSKAQLKNQRCLPTKNAAVMTFAHRLNSSWFEQQNNHPCFPKALHILFSAVNTHDAQIEWIEVHRLSLPEMWRRHTILPASNHILVFPNLLL